MELMFKPFVRYVDFQGRSRRSEYWLWALFLFLVYMALSILQYVMIFSMAASSVANGQNGDGAAASGVGAMGLIMLLKFVFWLAVLLPSMAVAVRRMHDINRSGWWIVFPYIVLLVAMIVVFSLNGESFINNMKNMEGMSNNKDPRAAVAFIMSIIRPMMWIILPFFLAKVVTFVFRVTEGTPGNNRFGPDPKGRGGNINVF